MMVLVVIEVDGEKRQDIVKFTRYQSVHHKSSKEEERME